MTLTLALGGALALAGSSLSLGIGVTVLLVVYVVAICINHVTAQAQVKRAKIEGNRPQIVLSRARASAIWVGKFNGYRWHPPECAWFELHNGGASAAQNIQVKVSVSLCGLEDPGGFFEAVSTDRTLGAGTRLQFDMLGLYAIQHRALEYESSDADAPSVLFLIRVTYEEHVYNTTTTAHFTAVHLKDENDPGAMLVDTERHLVSEEMDDLVN